MQTSSKAQPVHIYDPDSERFQESGWPILQNVMASIKASGKPYNTWNQAAILSLIEVNRAPDGQSLQYVVINRIRSRVRAVCRTLKCLAVDRDADLETIYQIFATGSQEMENLPPMPDWKSSDVHELTKIDTLRAYVRLCSASVGRRDRVVTRSQTLSSRVATAVQREQ
jgi:hypothetical protein